MANEIIDAINFMKMAINILDCPEKYKPEDQETNVAMTDWLFTQISELTMLHDFNTIDLYKAVEYYMDTKEINGSNIFDFMLNAANNNQNQRQKSTPYGIIIDNITSDESFWIPKNDIKRRIISLKEPKANTTVTFIYTKIKDHESVIVLLPNQELFADDSTKKFKETLESIKCEYVWNIIVYALKITFARILETSNDEKG